MRIHIFNPETEYALASGASFYTPPAKVEEMRRRKQLLPEAWARPGDAIIVDDVSSVCSDFRLLDWESLRHFFMDNPDAVIVPWGWNHALWRRLHDHGVPASALPELSEIDRIRELAHRRTTIVLTERWNKEIEPEYIVDVPAELYTEDQCREFMAANPDCWMKAPWSSSGRGVINTAADMTPELALQWCRGIIRRQGSVMAETAARRVADFATEWILCGGKAEYLGLSRFETSRRGKYITNYVEPQPILISGFRSLSNMDIERVKELQAHILESTLTGYEGPLGVDMIVEESGVLRPFTEVNLRHTMGMLNLLK
ncbi:MAG: hypothetical protein K2K93_04325 [Muribaculaceae bacterium]|nr:hypothetical protein [Muribaculaceae bacterium]